MTEVPCVQLEHMSEAEKRAYVLADNKLALNAGWDEDLLAGELEALMEIDLGFDIGVTGFSIPEIDALIDEQAPEEPGDPEDDLRPDANEVPARCRPGDLWQLGRHRLICGDALDAEVVSRLMDGDQARMVFTDPPYNVPIDGHVGGSGKTKHREFAMASGEMTVPEFTDFLRKSFGNLAAHSIDGAIRGGGICRQTHQGRLWPDACLCRGSATDVLADHFLDRDNALRLPADAVLARRAR